MCARLCASFLSLALPLDDTLNPGAALREAAARALLVGEAFQRLRIVATMLLTSGARIELAALRDAGQIRLGSGRYRFVVVDAVTISASGMLQLRRLRASDAEVPIAVLVPTDSVRACPPNVERVPWPVDEDGDGASRAAAGALLTWWDRVRPLSAPGGLTIDRCTRRVDVNGRHIHLNGREYAVLCALVAGGAQGAEIAELARVTGVSRSADGALAPRALRKVIERLRSALRRGGISIVAEGTARYRVIARAPGA